MRAARTVLMSAFAVVLLPASARALGQPTYITPTPTRNSVVLMQGQQAAPIWVDAADWPGVIRAAGDLQGDIRRVTGLTPLLVKDGTRPARTMIIVGTVGKSPLIDRLAREKKIDVSGISGKWESFFVETVANPMPGVSTAVVIAGSDKRGTIFGIYDLSEQIGVSPWYWWADVTPDHRDAVFMTPGTYAQGEPSVKYRGIFFNDEKPDLDYWVRAKFGEHLTPGGQPGTVANFNGQFYAKVFEVLLRMKANYLWPAMWNNAFAEDDVDNPRLADEYGIVMGTSHQEPMLRAQKEWDWHQRQQYGNWNYATHAPELETFWRDGVKARKSFENIYTLGLRGENDTAMVQGAAQSMALLETIVANQRKMLAEEVNSDVAKVPQLWCLYKEVQGYYENGLRVPDDVTLLWAEDNWGNVRRLPTPEERRRPGGAGVYYHFDYHGGPRSYQWVNTSPIAKIWEQMSLAKQYGADRVWIVNVGHFKGYELPTEYFLSLGWNTTRWNANNVNEFTEQWASREFGAAYAKGAAEIVATYSKFNGRRKPELLEAGTYSLTSFREADRVVEDYNALTVKAEALWKVLPASKQDAFYQLALFPAKASAIVNELYVAAAKNAHYASQGRASANDWADRTRELYKADGDLMTYFNKTFAGGKWDHFMDQSHIGYTTWRDPPEDTMDAIKLTAVDVLDGASPGIENETSAAVSPGAADLRFDSVNQQRSYIDVFNRGRAPFDVTVTPSAPWIVASVVASVVQKDLRVWVSIDWTQAPKGVALGTITIVTPGLTGSVDVEARNSIEVTRENLAGFVEGAGYVSIEPEHFTNRVDAGGRQWIRIEDYGRTLSGMRAEASVDLPAAMPGTDSPSLEYRMYLFTPGKATVNAILAPTLNFVPGRGLRMAISIDDAPPQVVTVVPAVHNAAGRDWEESVKNNARTVSTSHDIATAGYHTLKIWMVDPAVVVQKIVVVTGGATLPPSYLGPPESFHAHTYPGLGRPPN
ncbi:MAG: glycosyl hydrolase 115 family protein [Acidobacteriota bacterium]